MYCGEEGYTSVRKGEGGGGSGRGWSRGSIFSWMWGSEGAVVEERNIQVGVGG